MLHAGAQLTCELTNALPKVVFSDGLKSRIATCKSEPTGTKDERVALGNAKGDNVVDPRRRLVYARQKREPHC